MQIRNHKDLFAGVMFALLGAFFTIFSMRYAIRTAAHAGPGYFPFYLGILLSILGTMISLSAFSRKTSETRIEHFNLKVILLVLGSVMAFGFLLQPLGLLLTLLVVILMSSFASDEFRWKSTLLNASVLIALCAFVFVFALKLPFPLWPSVIN